MLRWVLNGNDVLLLQDYAVCDVYYFIETSTLVLNEKNKVFDDHAAAKFEDVTLDEVELILSKLTFLRNI